MARWYVCTMDDGILSQHKTKREAVAAVAARAWSLSPRRIRKGEYQYDCGCDNVNGCPTYYVMAQEGARRNGWEPDDA